MAENEIVGEALVALQHDDLKQMEITSVGHRLTILKAVYDLKIAQDIPIESDHYVPLCMFGFTSISCPLLILGTSRRRRSPICYRHSERYPTSRGATEDTGRKNDYSRDRVTEDYI